MKRAAIYARVSTLAGQSPQMQLDALREFAARNADLEVVAEYVDHGVSGTRESRPELNKLMDAVRKRQVQVVLVYRFDRLARSVRHLVNALHEFESLGVQFISYSENIDTGSVLGRALFVIASCLSELERNLIVERSAEGQRRAKARGKHVGRPRVEITPERVLTLQAQGRSQREIAAALGVSRKVVRRILGEAA